MISNKLVALEISNRVLEVGNLLNDIVFIAQDNCSPDELPKLKLAVGRVMGDLLIEIMNPLYQAHPDLKPDKLIVPKI